MLRVSSSRLQLARRSTMRRGAAAECRGRQQRQAVAVVALLVLRLEVVVSRVDDVYAALALAGRTRVNRTVRLKAVKQRLVAAKLGG
jgi:hypothetical protein